MDVVNRFRQGAVSHICVEEREHRHKVLAMIEPAVQAGGRETVPEVIDADFPWIFPGQVRMGPCPVKRGIYRFRCHRPAACGREEIWIPTAKNFSPQVILPGKVEHIVGHHNKAFFIALCVRDENFPGVQIDVLRQKFTAFVGTQAAGINQPKQHWGNFIQKRFLLGRRQLVD